MVDEGSLKAGGGEADGAPMSPGSRRALRAAVGGGLVVVAVAVVVGAYLQWGARNRSLWVVSGWPGALELSIDEGPPVVLEGPGHREATVGEGRHVARVVRPLPAEIEFEVASPGWWPDRDRTARVLNPGPFAVVCAERADYDRSGTPRENLPDNVPDCRAGEGYLEFADIDFPFGEFPPSISRTFGGDRVARRRLVVRSGAPQELYGVLWSFGQPADSRGLLEAWIEAAPDDGLALVYADAAMRGGFQERAEEVLRPRLETGPVNVGWHRAYQDVCLRTPQRTREVLDEYDALVRRFPADPDVLYLRGRIEPEPAGALGFYRRALGLAPDHADALRAVGYQLWAAGRFDEACDTLARLVGEGRADEAARQLYGEALLAARRDSDLEPGLRANLARGVAEIDWYQAKQLLLLLRAEGRDEETEELFTDLELRSEPTHALVAWLRAYDLYARGELAALARQAEDPMLPPSVRDEVRFWAAFEAGDEAAAAAIRSRCRQRERRGFFALLLAMRCEAGGRRHEAEDWLDDAIADLAPTDPVHGRFLELMRDPEVPSTAAVDGLLADPRVRAVLLSALAQRHPEAAQELLAAARELHYSPEFPHRFLASLNAL